MTVKDYLAIGYQVGKKNYWAIIRLYLVMSLLAACAAITVVGILVLPAIVIGCVNCSLKIYRGEKYHYKDSFSVGFKDGMWWKSILFFVILIAGGFPVTVIPFILENLNIVSSLLFIISLYLMTAWMFGVYLLADKNMLPIKALGKSRELAHQLGFWKSFTFMITLEIFSIIIYIPFGFGFLIYIFFSPFLLMSYVAIYENASGNPSVNSYEKLIHVQ